MGQENTPPQTAHCAEAPGWLTSEELIWGGKKMFFILSELFLNID